MDLFDVCAVVSLVGVVVQSWRVGHKIETLRSETLEDLTVLSREMDDLEYMVTQEVSP